MIDSAQETIERIRKMSLALYNHVTIQVRNNLFAFDPMPFTVYKLEDLMHLGSTLQIELKTLYSDIDNRFGFAVAVHGNEKDIYVTGGRLDGNITENVLCIDTHMHPRKGKNVTTPACMW